MRLAGGDARLWVKFERKAVRNAFKSELEGRPIYEEVDYVRIQQPGERDVYNQVATEDHKRRFPQQWAQFLAGAEQLPEGTPVGLLFPNQESVKEILLDLKIYTVEQLAQLSEHAIERLGMDGRKYVLKAKAALDKSEALKEVNRVNQELQDTKDQLRVVQQANARLLERMQQLEDRMAEPESDEAPPPRRGRPPKQEPTFQSMRAAAPPPERPEIVG